MPKRSRSGVVNRPVRVVAPTSVNGRQLERDHARPRALPDRDRQALILHRRVERLLQGARQPVDLIHEEHAPRLERGQKGRDVSLALECRTGGLHERDVQLARDDLRQRGLAQAGRASQQQMVQRVPARRGGLDRNGQLLAQRLLADEVLQPSRTQRAVELVLGDQVRSLDAGRLHHHDPARAKRSACAISSSALSPSASLSSPSASPGGYPSSSSPSRASARG